MLTRLKLAFICIGLIAASIIAAKFAVYILTDTSDLNEVENIRNGVWGAASITIFLILVYWGALQRALHMRNFRHTPGFRARLVGSSFKGYGKNHIIMDFQGDDPVKKSD